MKKIFVAILIFIFCSASKALAANPADTSMDYRIMPKLFCISYDEDSTRSFFTALPIRKDSIITLFNRTKEDEIKFCLTASNQFSNLIDGGVKTELIEDRGSGNHQLKQEVGFDLHKGIFGLGVVIPLQGHNSALGARIDSKYFTNYIHYEVEGWWNFGLDVKLERIKLEASYNEDKELYAGLAYTVITRWGSFSPAVFSDNDIVGGKILFVPD